MLLLLLLPDMINSWHFPRSFICKQIRTKHFNMISESEDLFTFHAQKHLKAGKFTVKILK